MESIGPKVSVRSLALKRGMIKGKISRLRSRLKFEEDQQLPSMSEIRVFTMNIETFYRELEQVRDMITLTDAFSAEIWTHERECGGLEALFQEACREIESLRLAVESQPVQVAVSKHYQQPLEIQNQPVTQTSHSTDEVRGQCGSIKAVEDGESMCREVTNSPPDAVDPAADSKVCAQLLPTPRHLNADTVRGEPCDGHNPSLICCTFCDQPVNQLQAMTNGNECSSYRKLEYLRNPLQPEKLLEEIGMMPQPEEPAVVPKQILLDDALSSTDVSEYCIPGIPEPIPKTEGQVNGVADSDDAIPAMKEDLLLPVEAVEANYEDRSLSRSAQSVCASQENQLTLKDSTKYPNETIPVDTMIPGVSPATYKRQESSQEHVEAVMCCRGEYKWKIPCLIVSQVSDVNEPIEMKPRPRHTNKMVGDREYKPSTKADLSTGNQIYADSLERGQSKPVLKPTARKFVVSGMLDEPTDNEGRILMFVKKADVQERLVVFRRKLPMKIRINQKFPRSIEIQSSSIEVTRTRIIRSRTDSEAECRRRGRDSGNVRTNQKEMPNAKPEEQAKRLSECEISNSFVQKPRLIWDPGVEMGPTLLSTHPKTTNTR